MTVAVVSQNIKKTSKHQEILSYISKNAVPSSNSCWTVLCEAQTLWNL